MQHEYHHVPVTALAFLRTDILLSGEGNHLRVYDCTSGNRLKDVKVFDGQAIHGIIVPEGKYAVITALVWGGPLVRPLYFHKNAESDITLGDVQHVGDWILDAAFAPQDDGLAAVVTAHSALLVVTLCLSKQNEPSLKLQQLLPGSNSILYSAHLSWLSSSQCLIASGTAFGDLIVWSATISTHEIEENFQADSQIHYSFSAHEGSVFGVRISPPLNIPEFRPTRILASCSDDRTIRLWDISDLGVESPSLTQVQRDTGFGSTAAADGHAPRCLAKAMGHLSRIWHVRYLHSQVGGEFMRILSFGEDATVITWGLKADGEEYSLSQCRSVTAHAGKNIWSVAMQKNTDIVVTGGADGAIAIHDTSTPDSLVDEISRTLLNENGENDNFRAYGFVDDDTLLATTNHGGTALISLPSTGHQVIIEHISKPLDGLRGYSVVASIPGYAFIAGTGGSVYMYKNKDKSLSIFAQISGKTAGLFPCILPSGKLALLVTTVGALTADLFVDHDSHSLESCETRHARLCLPPAFVTTSFACHIENDYFYSMLGSRSGELAIQVFCLGGDPTKSVPCSTAYSHVHGKEAVTSLHWLHRDESSYLFSTGRDGTYAVHRITLSGPSIGLELVHQLSLPFGPNIEGLMTSEPDNVFVWGFRSKNFVLYDARNQRETMTVECGGAHRNWALQPSHSGGTFVWNKASRVYVQKQQELPYRTINSGAHGREIKACAVSPFNNDGQRVIATGAEDTNIKLFVYTQTGFTCTQTLRKHNTGIQYLQWSSSGTYLFSSGGFEEFFVWKVSSDVPHIGSGVICESAHPSSGTSDLRVMGFDVVDHSQVSGMWTNGFVIAMAYSDSTLKFWLSQEKTWELLAAAEYLTSCLTHVQFLHNDGHLQEQTLVSAATDGHLTLWTYNNTNRTLLWTARYKVHQDAIHDLVGVQDTPNGMELVLTGGDDNAIGITIFIRLASDGLEYNRTGTLLIPRAHAAAVTGLVIIPGTQSANDEDAGNCRYVLVSTSIDQRIKSWQIDVDLSLPGVDGIKVQLLQDESTSVADVSSLEALELHDGTTGALLCGVGMDVWRLPATENFGPT